MLIKKLDLELSLNKWYLPSSVQCCYLLRFVPRRVRNREKNQQCFKFHSLRALLYCLWTLPLSIACWIFVFTASLAESLGFVWLLPSVFLLLFEGVPSSSSDSLCSSELETHENSFCLRCFEDFGRQSALISDADNLVKTTTGCHRAERHPPLSLFRCWLSGREVGPVGAWEWQPWISELHGDGGASTKVGEKKTSHWKWLSIISGHKHTKSILVHLTTTTGIIILPFNQWV